MHAHEAWFQEMLRNLGGVRTDRDLGNEMNEQANSERVAERDEPPSCEFKSQT
jgi:hypothetical protein